MNDVITIETLRNAFVERLKNTQFSMTETWLTPHATHDVVKVRTSLLDTAQRFACLDCAKQVEVTIGSRSVEWPADTTKINVDATERPLSPSEVQAIRAARATQSHIES